MNGHDVTPKGCNNRSVFLRRAAATVIGAGAVNPAYPHDRQLAETTLSVSSTGRSFDRLVNLPRSELVCSLAYGFLADEPQQEHRPGRAALLGDERRVLFFHAPQQLAGKTAKTRRGPQAPVSAKLYSVFR
ncbi:MAG TPA: hypothetical protein VG456_06830 [Candidatus Sulfopaludibacter sp.]|jgi:hypothetical protein|nr:hypothetical protein [Candidatus Sulfopaludibacter sp.]